MNFRFVCVYVLFGCLEKWKEERGKRTNFLVWTEDEIWVSSKFSWFSFVDLLGFSFFLINMEPAQLPPLYVCKLNIPKWQKQNLNENCQT